MITKPRLKELLQLNLRDERMTSSALFVKRLIARAEHGGGVPEFRIKNTTTGEFITSLDEFIEQIDEDKIFISYPYVGERVQTDRVTGFFLFLENYEIDWSTNYADDCFMSETYGVPHSKNIMFCMVYMNDGDEVVPLKISYPKVVNNGVWR